ncbi:MAG TPA: carboxypeptidase-like regulatory domain-containing protein [Chryseosolibacter sp.]
MKHSLSLSIASPCSQKWGSFAQVEGGGFCSQCSKIVVDFTVMTDEQIINHFRHASGETCGRFLPGQLRLYRLGEPVRVHPGMMLLKAGLMSLLFLALSRPASAQITPSKQNIELPGSYMMLSDSISFRGVVIDGGDKSPLPGVNVLLKGSTVGTVTDLNGRFEFPQPLKKGDVLVFSFIGMTTREFQVDGKSDIGYEVPLQVCLPYDIMGGVQVEGIYAEEKRGLWSRLKAFFKA